MDPLHMAQFLPVPLRRMVTRALQARLASVLTLCPEQFAGQRVLILGPARTVAEDLASLQPESFDVIVRMNNGLDTPVPELGGDGLRCDVLFHSLTRDARPVTDDSLRRAGVCMLVHRTPTRSAFLETVLASRRFRAPVQVRCLPLGYYRDLAAELGGPSPTTGCVAANFFLDAPLAELAVVGFTFFETAYCNGYDPAVRSDADARARIATAAHHAPGAEAALFARRVRAAREAGRRVTLGPAVQATLEAMGHVM